MMTALVICISILFITFLISYLVIFAVQRLALRHGLMDIPGERSSHEQPKPHGGGIAIVLLTIVGVLVYGCGFSNSSWDWYELLAYTIGSFLVAAVSLFDDIRSLPNRIRFASHSFCAILAILAFGYWSTISLPILGKIHLGMVGLPITFIWIVGLTNAYNFMDGIDGIAGGQGVVAGLGWAVFGWMIGHTMLSLIGLLLAGSCLGFLIHNWSPARIFMGDVGSAFLGYTLAILPLAAFQTDPRMEVVGILLVWPFVFDTIFTFFRRLKNRESVFSAHRSHLYQRLIIIGYKHHFVTFCYIGLALFGMLLSYLFATGEKIAEWLVVIGLIVGAGILWLFVFWQERKHSLLTT